MQIAVNPRADETVPVDIRNIYRRDATTFAEESVASLPSSSVSGDACNNAVVEVNYIVTTSDNLRTIEKVEADVVVQNVVDRAW